MFCSSPSPVTRAAVRCGVAVAVGLPRTLLLAVSLASPLLPVAQAHADEAVPQAVVLTAPASRTALSLAEVGRLVNERNRDVLAARRAIEGAGAQVQQADVRPNPVLSLNSSGISRDPGIGGGGWNAKRIDNTVRLDQTLERGNKRSLRVATAQNAEQAARLDLDDVLRRQQIGAASAYYDLRMAQDKVALLEGTAAIMARMLGAAEARLKAGDLAASEVARIQVDAERAAGDLRLARGELVRSRQALAWLIGADMDAGTGSEAGAASLEAGDAWPVVQPAATAAAGAAAAEAWLARRADVRAALKRVAAADAALALARSQRTRDVTVGAQFERYPGSAPVNSIGFAISVPLFFGNDFSGDIRAAETDRLAALDAVARARAMALAEYHAAAADLAVARDRLARYEGSLLAAARRSADAAEFAFERGATSVLELLDARRSYRGVQLEALDARADHARALFAWQTLLRGDVAPAAGGRADSGSDSNMALPDLGGARHRESP